MSSLRDAVRDKLREDKVKLWLPPYDDASKLDALAKAYAAALQASEPDVAAHLADLRQSALAKLAQRTLITLQGTNFSVRVSTELPGAVARAAVAAALGVAAAAAASLAFGSAGLLPPTLPGALAAVGGCELYALLHAYVYLPVSWVGRDDGHDDDDDEL